MNVARMPHRCHEFLLEGASGEPLLQTLADEIFFTFCHGIGKDPTPIPWSLWIATDNVPRNVWILCNRYPVPRLLWMLENNFPGNDGGVEANVIPVPRIIWIRCNNLPRDVGIDTYPVPIPGLLSVGLDNVP